MNEEQYIKYRKRKAFRDSLAFYICGFFPLDKNLISVCTFEGRSGFCCNPKYIVEEIHKSNPDIKFVWFVNDDVFDVKEFPPYIKKVKNNLWSRAYWLSKSKIWIDNYRKPLGTKKRKGQYYLQTWHGTIGFKSTGLLRGTAFSPIAYLVSKNDSDMIDDVVIDSKWCEIIDPKALVYGGSYLKFGAPRCDILYGEKNEARKKFREKHHIEENAKVIMFAPTFREGSINGKREVFSEIWTLDFDELIDNLEKKFGGKWYLCLRVHPQLANSFEGVQSFVHQDRILDESKADDMYEILAGMDALVTDYSSVAMDAELMHIPIFIYADDIEKYVKDRGSVLWNFARNKNEETYNNKDVVPGINVQLPFSVSRNNEELKENIQKFDDKEYATRLLSYEEAVGLVFDGKASKRTAEEIIRKMV